MLTLTEAATLLGLSPITLRIQVRNGKLKAVKRGRDWHVSQKEVDRYGRENRKEPVLLPDPAAGVDDLIRTRSQRRAAERAGQPK